MVEVEDGGRRQVGGGVLEYVGSECQCQTEGASIWRLNVLAVGGRVCDEHSGPGSGSYPAARWGNRLFIRTGFVPFYINECLVGMPHERLASNICKQVSHRPIGAICFSFLSLKLD